MDVAIQLPWFRRSFFPSLFPSRIYDQNFGELVSESELLGPFPSLYNTWPSITRLRSWLDSRLPEMRMDKDHFLITLDVKHFSPQELTVKINGEFIEVHGKHQERQDIYGNYVSREFLRKYKAPAGVIPSIVTSSLSLDGVLTITVQCKLEDIPEHTIPITRDDKCAISAPQK